MSRQQKPNGRRVRVANYFRNSHVQSEHSIERQHAEVDPYVKAKGWEVVEVIEDRDISGTEFVKRPGIQRILALAREGLIDGICADDWDRLLRLDLLEMGEFLSPLRRAGVWIESVAQGRFNAETSSGRLIMGITSEAKHGDVLSIARKSLTEQLRLARDVGMPPLPKPPYGYRRVEDMSRPPNRHGKRPGKWVIVPEEAAVVRLIFEWYARGEKPGWIARELRRRGVPTSRGYSNWCRQVIRCMLDNVAYIGDRAWGKTAPGKFYKQIAGQVQETVGPPDIRPRPREEWIVATGTHEPIITDRELWKEVFNRRERSRLKEVSDDEGNVLRHEGESTAPVADAGAFTLSRLLVCGECGSWMTGFNVKTRKRVKSYVCARYCQHARAGCVRCEVREEDAVNSLIAELRRLLAPERQEWLRVKLRERLQKSGNDKSLVADRKRLKALDSQLKSARSRLLEVSRDMLPEVEEGIRQLRDQIQSAEESIERREKVNPVRDLKIAVDASAKALFKLEEALESGNRLALKEALRGIIEKVVMRVEVYKSPTGAERRRPCGFDVTLCSGTGLDLLADLECSHSATCQVLCIDLHAVS